MTMTTLIQNEQKRQKIMARMREHMVWDWGADENFVPIYCNVCLLAAVDPALL